MSDLWMLFIAFLLYFGCSVLIVAEVFVPSGGIISLCAIACLAGGLYMFFSVSTLVGLIGIGLAVFMIPTVIVLAFKLLPKTSFGKHVRCQPMERRNGDAVPDGFQLESLLGQEGVVITALRPVGNCNFGGKRIQCSAESGFIEKDTTIKVVKVEGTRVVVRMCD